ncbi:ABC transporter permease [Salimicrobium halophilum]|uniref:ABC-2 type transport system permease protein n=1 Tax=Salimicrobium halophilum TaxID=86666 RepID=A0A1G8R6W8_9BACI|nr:ABC transporter permease subunit [Salimicrobium halophilum]SDJ12711.1 ABC-2 type transport system permease protein [Salimicrobium halophilum]
MIALAKREFFDSFKSIKSLLIILFTTLVSWQTAQYLSSNPLLIQEAAVQGKESEFVTAVTAFIVISLGFLFVFSVSHDIINKEIEGKTIRLLVTKKPRSQIMFGKFLGTLLFWVAIFSISYLVTSLIAQVWVTEEYLRMVAFLTYIVGMVFLVSTLVERTKLTMFIGVFAGIIIPILGIASTIVDKWWMIGIEYLLPYTYIEKGFLMIIPFLMGLMFFLISMKIMSGKDL